MNKTKQPPPDTVEPETTPAQEWGSGHDTGKAIACGGDDDCPVPGTMTSQPKKKDDAKKEDEHDPRS